jgi:plastocyanin
MWQWPLGTHAHRAARTRRVARCGLVFAVLALALPALSVGVSAAESQVEIYASGFINPKGMAFAPDGTLYVAESGQPGAVMVPLPVNYGGAGPIGTNARISRVRPGGQREDVVTGLPNIGLYGGVEMLGAASIAVLNGQLYEIAAGHISISPRLSSFMDDGMLTMIADLGAFNDANPPPASNGDAVPMGNPYDIIPLGGNFYVTDGNYNRVLRVTPAGDISIAAAWENSPVTVGAAAGPDGNLYVCQFSPAPYTMGTGRIDRVTPDGQVTEGVVKNLTTPIDVAFAPDGTMYVLRYAAEFSPEKLRYQAFGGEVERVNADGSTSPIVTNLVFPTAMTFGPDGALYVTNYGNEANKGEGQVLRVTPGDTPVKGPDVPAPDETGQYTNAQPTVTPDSGAAPVATITIHEGDDPMQWGFDPAELTIEAGQAVTFTNGGRVGHTATASNGAFDTGLLQGGQSVVIRFDQAGTFDYFCQPHPWMKGRIIVTGAGGAATPVAGGATLSRPDPPSISPWKAAGFVALIVALVLAGGFAMRRTSRVTPPPADGDD